MIKIWIESENGVTDCYEEISETRRVGSMAKFYDIAAHYQAPPEEAKPTYLLYTHAWDIWDRADAEGISLAEAKDAYVEGLEGWANLSEAQRWYELAAKNGDPDAKAHLRAQQRDSRK